MADFHRITDAAQVGPLIRTIRRRQDVSQLDIADALGLNTSTNICSYETGRRMPDLATAISILATLGMQFAVVPAPVKGRRCSVADCGRKYWAREMCRVHYVRWWRNGDVNERVPIGEAHRQQRATRTRRPRSSAEQ
jgi:transcriptional regulator with XRE-family HTH domain